MSPKEQNAYNMECMEQLHRKQFSSSSFHNPHALCTLPPPPFFWCAAGKVVRDADCKEITWDRSKYLYADMIFEQTTGVTLI